MIHQSDFFSREKLPDKKQNKTKQNWGSRKNANTGAEGRGGARSLSHILILEGIDELSRRVVVGDSVEDFRHSQYLRRGKVADLACVTLTLAVLPGHVHGARRGTTQESSAPKLLAERLFTQKRKRKTGNK